MNDIVPASAEISGSTLVIPRVTVEDAGTYRCVLSHATGVTYATMILYVEGNMTALFTSIRLP